MHIILQTWSWLTSKNLTILVMGNNGIAQCKLTFVQASCFLNTISDNNSIIVWKTIFFLQTCATREYDVIKMLVLTDVFPRAPFENRFVYLLLLFTPPNRTWGNLTSFSHSYLRTYLGFRPPVYIGLQPLTIRGKLNNSNYVYLNRFIYLFCIIYCPHKNYM